MSVLYVLLTLDSRCFSLRYKCTVFVMVISMKANPSVELSLFIHIIICHCEAEVKHVNLEEANINLIVILGARPRRAEHSSEDCDAHSTL